MAPFHVALVQFRPVFGRPEENLTRLLDLLQGVEADLAILPELALTGYLFTDRQQVLELAESARCGPRLATLIDFAQQRRMHLAIGFAERSGRNVFNSALLTGPAGPIGVYRKLHLFANEKDLFTAGNRPPRVFRVGPLRVGLMVCFDWAFPEVARSLALAGADLLAHPANLVLDHGQRAMGVRALENGVFAATANRWGVERRGANRLEFTGRSQLVGPRGDVRATLPRRGDRVQVVEIDPTEARDKWVTARNHLLQDRRPPLYRTR